MPTRLSSLHLLHLYLSHSSHALWSPHSHPIHSPPARQQASKARKKDEEDRSASLRQTTYTHTTHKQSCPSVIMTFSSSSS